MTRLVDVPCQVCGEEEGVWQAGDGPPLCPVHWDAYYEAESAREWEEHGGEA